jgi:cytochrome c biogenesis protein CcdA
MSTLTRFVVYMLIGILMIFLAAVLGDNGPWYFAWLVGTVMIVLISATGAVLLDTQEEEQRQRSLDEA